MSSPPPRRRPLPLVGAMTIGSAAYAISIYLTAILNIPGADNVQIRPGVVIPIICGALFGPAAGFVSGFVGHLLADQALGWGWWPFWYLASGVMGLASGLFRPASPDYSRLRTALVVVGRAAIGIAVGIGVAAISELWVTQSSWEDVLWVNFMPAFLFNLLNAAILVPIVLLFYGLWRSSVEYELP
jgi:energy-coupling factor transport system substrate-specific component